MAKNLVIVESPAKARTLSRFLGNDFEVASSYGHIRDLPKKGLGVDIDKSFEPTYEVPTDKKKTVAELKKLAKTSEVWLASDEDREGEAIAWHLATLLNLDIDKTKRIVFHEITKPAIEGAVKKPRTIDMKLVDAQQARRVLDRLVGYELSPILWKKVRTGLSAGRVQSVAVRLIVEREREIKNFKRTSSFKLSATFDINGQELVAQLPDKLASRQDALEFLKSLIGAKFNVNKIEQKPGQRSPSAPFTTSTLQQEAARRLGFGVRQTMSLAQRLYEDGHITYMRTDSTNLSPLAITAAKNYIEANFGSQYFEARQYRTKTAGAQEAHEAIRPTDFKQLSAGADERQKKLYQLIWRRTLASQMASAKIQKTVIEISISSRGELLAASGEVVSFDGFIKVYGKSKEDQILPVVKEGQTLPLTQAEALEEFSRPPARYSEAGLVRQLESLGIGRPSTYAPTISTIQDRGYIEKADVEGKEQPVNHLVLSADKINEQVDNAVLGADRAKLIPTHLADMVTDFLSKYFGEIIDYGFTARAEESLDEIAEGNLKWQQMLSDFYEKFHPLVKKSEQASREEAAQVRELGIDPKTKLPIYARYGRYGPVLQLGDSADKEQKVQFAAMPEGESVESVSLGGALKMLELPRTIGTTADGKDIVVGVGRFGPYVRADKTFASITGYDLHKITLVEARKLLEEQAEKRANREIKEFGKLKVLRGPYGPYITDGKKNAKIPKDIEPEDLSEEQATEILAKAPEARRSKRRRIKKS